MLADPPIGCDYSRSKTHGYSIYQFDGIYARLEHSVKNLIIIHQLRKHPSSERPGSLVLYIIIMCLALIAAEFLVHPAILYLIAAMKTLRHASDYLLSVFHPV